ncbi:fatty acid-binding protein [Tribolium castaneum]|uniref:FABP-like protein n=1 Tax=Tribolium castaneum TaxID=7070 RepID=D6X2H6_TRICA|nr:PREDICTED: fatty acid-binding protein [Tribolium castaneum]XP_008195971.1 PREDICTED: fatty acid-binding protein [Tribolium castaneum]XP_008195978.1 PREDICTED: fatty acid-binding protein [Tribolium castaneum]XP_008195984.1 PREDICTED: fatty acid-binding protein [Tribolium castaneum]XP_015839111.1 PREDICTED: fatty acid-binding protein [Tribolium castaneum]EFA10745.2 FABP-like protein [Tribolium castaneum]|eukprot:XP_008195965.1 PREDICTED: fatty acid-binding protein [Tribolium castaneum]
MSKLVGTYVHEKSENLDQYYSALGVPYIARKMMSFTSPKLTITNDGDTWTITTSTKLRTLKLEFKLGEEYDEDMPGGTLKSTTTVENDSKLVTVSIGPENTKIIRTYEATDDGCVLTLKHDKTGTEGKRYFKKA